MAFALGPHDLSERGDLLIGEAGIDAALYNAVQEFWHLVGSAQFLACVQNILKGGLIGAY